MKIKERPLVAISACLLGSPVRYDSNHCKEQWIVEELSNFVDFYPLCPEMEMGLDVPRKEIHLYFSDDNKSNIKLHEPFIKCVFAHFRFNNLNASISSLQDFHKRYKYILMEHSPNELQKLGQISANSSNLSCEEVHNHYYEYFFAILTIEATAKKCYNTFLHIMGYLKKKFKRDEKEEILIMFNDFKEGILNYMMPVRFLDFMTKKYKENYLEQQYYFSPYPKQLKI